MELRIKVSDENFDEILRYVSELKKLEDTTASSNLILFSSISTEHGEVNLRKFNT